MVNEGKTVMALCYSAYIDGVPARGRAQHVTGDTVQEEIPRVNETTYERSNDVAGCDAARLCAKLRLPPNCPLDEL
jgi:hypothetical protein